MQRDFRQHYGEWAIVTGASSGIGEAFAHALAARSIRPFLVARRAEELCRVAAEIQSRHGVEAAFLALDLAEPEFIDRLVTAFGARDLGLVIGNAAYNPAGAFLDLSREILVRMLDVNARANLLLANAFLPRLRAQGRGGFMMVASTEAYSGVPFSACYSASKAFVLSLGEALWGECLDTGVDVTVLVPGATDTPLLASRDMGDLKVTPLSATDVAEIGLNFLGRGPSIVPATRDRWTQRILRRLPRAWLIRKMAPTVREMIERSVARTPPNTACQPIP